MPINQKLLDILTSSKPFVTPEARQALDALIMAGNDQNAFLMALSTHQAFWYGIDPSLKDQFTEAKNLLVDGEGDTAVKASNNLNALWVLAVKKRGHEDLNAAQLKQHSAKIKTVGVAPQLVETYNAKAKLFENNKTLFDNKVTSGNRTQNDLLKDLFNELLLNQQNIILRKINEDDKYLSNIFQATNANEFKTALGITLTNELLEPSIEMIYTMNVSVIQASNDAKFNEFMINAALDNSLFQPEHKQALIKFFNHLPPAQQNIILNKVKNDISLFNQVLQATSSEQIVRLLKVNVIDPPGIELLDDLLENNSEYNKAKANLLEPLQVLFNEPIPAPKNAKYNVNTGQPEQYAQDLEAYSKRYINAHSYAAFLQYLETYIDAFSPPEQQNLQDAFILSGSLAEFKKCITNKANFDKVMEHKVGGTWFGDHLPSKTSGYVLPANVIVSFQNMTEQEFNDLKSASRTARLAAVAIPKVGYYALVDAEKHLALEQELVLDPIKAKFAAIQQALPAFKKGLQDLLSRDRTGQNPHTYMSEQVLESATDTESAEFLTAIREALEEGQATLDTLNQQIKQLQAYYDSIEEYKPRGEIVQNQLAWINETLNTILQERQALTTYLQKYQPKNDAPGIIASMETVITASRGTTRRLKDDPEFWETVIRAVDPAHAPAKSFDTSDNLEEEEVDLNSRMNDLDPLATYEPRVNPGQVLEYVVKCATAPAEDIGVFRKSKTPHARNPSLEHVKVVAMKIPDNAAARVTTALKAAVEFLKDHKKGQPIILGGKNVGAIADYYHALLALGISKNEITFQPTCAFDPDKHKGRIYGFKSESLAGQSEQRFSENKELIAASKESLQGYQETHQYAHEHMKDLTQRSKGVTQGLRKSKGESAPTPRATPGDEESTGLGSKP